MGSEDLFHKRKIRDAKSISRKTKMRSQYDRVLLVCEGEKTEPNYFKELREYYKLNPYNIQVDGSSYPDPANVFKRAEKLWKREKRKNDPYNRVYCIFDKDTHSSYEQTLQKIYQKDTFYAANSVPSFEYWLLLHFTPTTKPFATKGKKRSAAKAVEQELKQHFPGYSKGDKHIFSKLVDRLEDAIRNAEQSLSQAKSQGTDNPSTKVHKLVDYLQNL